MVAPIAPGTTAPPLAKASAVGGVSSKLVTPKVQQESL